MKLNPWMILGVMLSTSLLAQQTAPPAPATPPPAAPVTAVPATPPPAPASTNAPAAKSAKKKSAQKKAPSKKAPSKTPSKTPTPSKPAMAELKTTPLHPGSATVVAVNVNVRGQAKLNSEVITKINKGQSVTVLEEIVKNSGPQEPSAWAKILLPPDSKVWVNTHYVDATAKTIIPKKLNVRSGPGENYSVLGLMAQGDAVKEISTKGDWIQIEAPATAYAFVAAQFLKQDGAGDIAATTPTSTLPPLTTSTPPPPTATTPPAEPAAITPPPPVVSTPPPAPPEPAPTSVAVADSATVGGAPTTAPALPPPPEPPAPVAAVPPATTTADATPAPVPAGTDEALTPENPPVPRIVEREGIVRGMTSIQAPSFYSLISAENKKTIDYLHAPSSALDLSRYKGLRVVVTGEEGLDERWPNTPVLTIQKIVVVTEGPGT